MKDQGIFREWNLAYIIGKVYGEEREMQGRQRWKGKLTLHHKRPCKPAQYFWFGVTSKPIMSFSLIMKFSPYSSQIPGSNFCFVYGSVLSLSFLK